MAGLAEQRLKEVREGALHVLGARAVWQRELSVKRPYGRDMLGCIEEQQGGQCGQSRVNEGENRPGELVRWGRSQRSLWASLRTLALPVNDTGTQWRIL